METLKIIFGHFFHLIYPSLIDNVVQANLLAMTREHLNGETINIACGRRTSVNQLLNILKNIMGSKVLPIYQEPRKGDVRHSLADIQKGKQILNYDPKIEIEAGLKKTVEYFKKLRTCLPADRG